MKNKSESGAAYRLRFLPLIVAAIILATVAVYDLSQQFSQGAEVISFGKYTRWSLFLTIAAFIYAISMNDTKKERDEKEEEARDALLSPEERAEKLHEKERQEGETLQKNNIMIRSVHLLLGVLLIIFGIILLMDRAYLFGAILTALGVLYTIYSVFLLRKWIALLKFYKEERKENN
jgi:putative Ca2+/H+ antiporter (TMEM165/GDT1 family)